jgi:hypothetical protein
LGASTCSGARGARGRVLGGRSPRQPPEKAPDEEKKRLFVFSSTAEPLDVEDLLDPSTWQGARLWRDVGPEKSLPLSAERGPHRRARSPP